MKSLLQRFGKKKEKKEEEEEVRQEQVNLEVTLQHAKPCDSLQTRKSEYGSLDSGKGSQVSETEPLAVGAWKKDAFWKKWKEDQKAKVSQMVSWIGTTGENEGWGA